MRRRSLLVTAASAVLLCAALPATTANTAQVAPSVRFTTAGDFAATSNTGAVLDAIAAADPALHLALGDLSYGATGAEEAWCNFVTARVGIGFPFELLAGNHESNGQNGNINDFSACLPNQLPGLVGTYGRQWYVDVPQAAPLVRFVMVSPALPFADGTWSYAAGSPRYQWTAAAIDGARVAGIPWVVAGMHKPCLSVGQYTCEPGADLVNLFVNKKVDLVLSGHEHLYQRTKQLGTAPGCPALTPGAYVSACVTDGDNELLQGRGTTFVTVGTGGVSLRDVNSTDAEAPYFAAWSGLNVNPTWGSLDVRVEPDQLTGSFLRGSGGNFTDSFTIREDTSPSNAAPVATIATPNCTGLTCSFDGSGSTDSDGSIASHAWSFGDGSTDSGSTATRVYSTAGTYTVTLTVTDDDGATGSANRTVTVTAPAPADLAVDGFGRSLPSGWGSADTGGAWTSTSSAANFAVGSGVGSIRMGSAGQGPSIYLNSLSSNDTDAEISVSFDKPATGGGIDLSLVARRVSGAGDYRGKVRLLSGGGVRVGLSRSNATGVQSVIVAESLVPGLTYAAAEQLRVRVQATGTAPTTLRIKVWKVGQSEPAAWQLTGTDTTTGLQVAGSIGVLPYLSGSATNSPVVASFDDLLARRATP